MILRKLSLRNFRNYDSLDLEFSASANFICGNNGQGKSNFLEAIHLLAVTRSFRPCSDRDLLKFERDQFEISGEFVDEVQIRRHVNVCYRSASGKEISLDRKRLSSAAALIGVIPVVHFSPESHRITSGPPAERRRLVDMLLCQSSPAYLSDWQEYQRSLKQRNALLGQNASPKTLAAWSESLANYGCKIIAARRRFVETFAPLVLQAYRDISASSSSLQLTYQSQLAAGELTPENYLNLLSASQGLELRRKQTQVGPHRDDFVFDIDGRELRHFGSRGEHKSTLLALKMAEATYFKDKSANAPLILLDDLQSELDAMRLAAALRHFQKFGQLFVTALAPLEESVRAQAVRYEVIAGEMKRVN